jgi:inosose dehydratase
MTLEGNIRIANAPCSWGALEFEGLAEEPIGYRQMLDELRETGYTGTELGDWGFMPTEPAALRAALEGRGLAMVGAFVPVALKDAAAHADGAATAVRVARLLAAVAEPGGTPPLIVLADENGSDPVRTANAGRVMPDLGLSGAEWRTFAQGAEHVARAVRDATGLATAFHHHCAGYVETPDEIAQLLELTDPDLLGLVFDTGHFLFGAGGAQDQTVQAALDRFGARIRHMHFKDCHPGIAAQSRAEGWDYFEAVRRGVFCELGQGAADFAAATAWLRARDYRGWIVVEQDVLPGMGSPRESAARNRAYLRTIGL